MLNSTRDLDPASEYESESESETTSTSTSGANLYNHNCLRYRWLIIIPQLILYALYTALCVGP